jgi:CMP/dCMP kinase
VVQAVDSARMVVAIDGPSGSGKSTVARGVASRLGFGYLDTGAMYRAVTWLVLDAGLALSTLAEQADQLQTLLAESPLQISTDPGDRHVSIAGHDVTEVIRGSEVTTAVSAVAATPVVRAHLSVLQRTMAATAVAERGGIIVEGRDIGTVIFPDARLKIWLTASPEARGRRRATELSDGTQPETSAIQGTLEQLAKRDGLDSTRQVSPLQRAEDAHVLDTTPLSAEQVIDAVLALWDTIELPDSAQPAGSPSATGPTQPARTDHLLDSTTGAVR